MSDVALVSVLKSGYWLANVRMLSHGDPLMKRSFFFLLIVLDLLVTAALAKSGSQQKKHLLVLGEEKGYRHESVSHAMATIERLGQETGLWDSVLRTDTEVLTKKKLEYNAKNLDD